MKARSALFTLFGDVVRPAGGEAWLSVITGCMATLGFNAPAVRTALHRMAGEGWVEPRKEGRYAAYRLTDRGVDRLDQAAERIYRLRSLEWDGRWRLLLAPDLTDADRIAELGWMGYGRLQEGVWASPHPHPPAAVTLAGPGSTPLDGGMVPDDADLASRAWALQDLRERHQRFLADWADVAVPADPLAMLGMRLRLVHQWRSFLFLDPGLPAEVLPTPWAGVQAAQRFAAVYEQLREGSWAAYGELVAAAPAAPATGRPDLDTPSPFAQGLAAMQQLGPDGGGLPRERLA